MVSLLTDEEYLDDLIMEAMEQNKTPVSKSRLHGWGLSTDHKNYRRISGNEFMDVLEGLIRIYKNH